MILRTATEDRRFPLLNGAGSDAVHKNPQYAYAVTRLMDDSGISGTGLAFTLGEGNELVCKAIQFYAEQLVGKDIEEIMADFGTTFRCFANAQQFRWLGPHKGVVHLALASVTNACFDLWAKKRGVPLWKLLVDLSPEAIINLLDFSYLDEVLTPSDALAMLQREQAQRENRQAILREGYTAYDTSVGWFNYSDEEVVRNCRIAVDKGFRALKLKVGSPDEDRDVRRAMLVREAAGNTIKVMLDANQQWSLPQAIRMCNRLRDMNPYWIEEPTHPDDILAHEVLADSIKPFKLALGEHVPNSIIFKNYLQTGCAGFIQVDAVRVGGVSEFLLVSLLCRKFGVPVVPHVGDMGQLHQHLVLANHIVMGHEALFLEHIPHLKQYFVHPVNIEHGVYRTPQEAGSSCDLLPL
ncbi:enolase C-terminal domain-like protein [Flavihumibacter petaseus]|uniref:Mandelate racemase/muconate lactonizing enzyme family protein n=1 Tax=Flavihumibacter petaseus NBRC 106054 TaxID=1220578 RepID=A0A0E9MYH6_9BACT|nr:enolase C-terminal domain-like protein [Flavihumibacter petaseus]GAO42787.1 mandelate racemase/muconate lactonizing enzyme family protein [Flavihumibacter petaseus NBRC 106054]